MVMKTLSNDFSTFDLPATLQTDSHDATTNMQAESEVAKSFDKDELLESVYGW